MDKKKKILVVDDEPDLLDVVKLRLEANNFEVLTAANEAAALRQAELGPDVILLDILMPSDGEGYLIFSKLKANNLTKDIPVIFLTRKTEDRKKALGLGINYFVVKPYEPIDLLEKINLALKGEKEVNNMSSI